jgi:hypothetical protein
MYNLKLLQYFIIQPHSVHINSRLTLVHKVHRASTYEMRNSASSLGLITTGLKNLGKPTESKQA